MLTLVVPAIDTDTDPPRRIAVDRTPFTLGAHPDNDLVLPRGTVDRHHARIELHDGRHVIIDHHTTHGTTLNGRRVLAPTELRPGDQLTVGEQHDMTVEFASPDTPPVAH